MADFVALDVETANPNLASLCQIGIVTFEGASVVDSWESLVDPEDYFAETNTAVHGITEELVLNAENFSTLHEGIALRLSGKIVVSHTAFDRVAMARACEKYSLPCIESTWLDSAKVVRRVWGEFARRGYGLKNVAEKLGITFRHHSAVEDARAAGLVLTRAIETTGLSIEDWLERIKRPISPKRASQSKSSSRVAMKGNAEGVLHGEEVVFTGKLSIKRKEAAAIAAAVGCDVAASVTQSTTLLVVGDQDTRMLAGRDKSSKHRKAEKLIAQGQSIRILGETDFRRLTDLAE